jgi:PhnB protein
MPVIPYLFYEDVAAAAAWLCEAFDFTETLRHTTRDGTVTHVELTCGGESIMLGAVDRREGQALGYRVARGQPHSSFVFIIIPDVEAHFERAVRGGATVISAPEDKPYGQRQYTVQDPEGQRWSFSEQVRDLLPEEWGATRLGWVASQ